MAGFTTTDGELSLREMFADPIVQTMMDLDGVTKEDVTGLFRAMRKRMASGADEHHKAGRAQGVWRTGTPLGRPRTDADASSSSTNPE